MGLATARTIALHGIDAIDVHVEAAFVDAASHASTFVLVGLPDAALREARERVRTGLRSAALELPPGDVVVNLAPAGVRKAGSGYDLAIALAVLAAVGHVPAGALARVVAFGELGLDAAVRPVAGALVAGEATRRAGLSAVLCAPESAPEAAVAGIAALPCRTLRDAVDVLTGTSPIEPARPAPPQASPLAGLDLRDVRGQPLARRALEIAAAGAHHLLLVGPPGVGKTMLARRLAGILPPLSGEDALAVTRVHSVAGLLPDGSGLVSARPFRAPHHSASAPALIGGGPLLRPGELSLATHGVLFLDELPEFRRDALESLRGPLEDGVLQVARARGTVSYPCVTTVVAAMNPCPCGAPDASGCACSPERVAAYRRRVSGPLLDRIDLGVRLVRPAAEVLLGDRPEGSTAVAERVAAAVERQAARGSGRNARIAPDDLRRVAALDAPSEELVRRAIERMRLSPRGVDRILRVARTIADLAGADDVGAEHLAEAIGLRLGSVA